MPYIYRYKYDGGHNGYPLGDRVIGQCVIGVGKRVHGGYYALGAGDINASAFVLVVGDIYIAGVAGHEVNYPGCCVLRRTVVSENGARCEGDLGNPGIYREIAGLLGGKDIVVGAGARERGDLGGVVAYISDALGRAVYVIDDRGYKALVAFGDVGNGGGYRLICAVVNEHFVLEHDIGNPLGDIKPELFGGLGVLPVLGGLGVVGRGYGKDISARCLRPAADFARGGVESEARRKVGSRICKAARAGGFVYVIGNVRLVICFIRGVVEVAVKRGEEADDPRVPANINIYIGSDGIGVVEAFAVHRPEFGGVARFGGEGGQGKLHLGYSPAAYYPKSGERIARSALLGVELYIVVEPAVFVQNLDGKLVYKLPVGGFDPDFGEAGGPAVNFAARYLDDFVIFGDKPVPDKEGLHP